MGRHAWKKSTKMNAHHFRIFPGFLYLTDGTVQFFRHLHGGSRNWKSSCKWAVFRQLTQVAELNVLEKNGVGVENNEMVFYQRAIIGKGMFSCVWGSKQQAHTLYIELWKIDAFALPPLVV